MKNKVFLLVTVLILAFSMVACGGGGDDGGDSSSEDSAVDAYDVQTIDSDGLEIEAYDHKIAEDDEGNKVIVISFKVTNNLETDSGFQNRMCEAYQNGEELSMEDARDPETDEVYRLGEGDIVAPGETHDLVLCFALIDEETPIELDFHGYTVDVEHASMTINL